MKKLLIIFFILSLFVSNTINGQISHFSQFYSTPMTIAPSFAGMTGASRISLNYRDQWPKLPGTFVTFALGADHYFPKIKSGVGILAYRDQAGTGNLSLTDVGVVYSYRLKVGEKRQFKDREWYLVPGMTFKYSQRAIDFYKLTFGDEYNPQTGLFTNGTIETPPIAKTGYYDFSASLMGFSNYFWGGFSADHLLMPNQSLTYENAKIPMKFSVFGGYKYLINKRKKGRFGEEPESVTFAFHYRYQGGYDQFDIGAYWSPDPFTLGAWVRGLPVLNKGEGNYSSIDAIIVLVGFKVNPKLKIGYSYDLTVSGLLSHTGGAHEISLVYEFNQDLKRYKKHRHAVVPCPVF